MRIRQTNHLAKGAAPVAIAASLAFALAGCAGGRSPARTAESPKGAPAAQHDAGSTPQQNEVLATIKGQGGIVITINSAKRETGGFVTVSGTVKNTGDQPYTQAALWRGNEQALLKNGGSFAGATLTDRAGRKRYYVLRDTEGRCLCVTGLDIIPAGQTMPVFAQFPAPPPTTTQVDFDLPTFPTASIVISQ